MTTTNSADSNDTTKKVFLPLSIVIAAAALVLIIWFGVANNDSNNNDGSTTISHTNGLNTCRQRRLDTAVLVTRLSAFVGDEPDDERIALLEELLDVNMTQDVQSTGTWTPLEAVIEYTYASKAENNKAMRFVDRQLLEESVQWKNASGSDDAYYLAANFRDTAQVLTSGGPPVNITSTSYREFTFRSQANDQDGDCDVVITKIYYILPEFIRQFTQTAQYIQSNHSIYKDCTEIMELCSDTPPYASVEECLHFLSSLPVGCSPKEGALQGNTTACRRLHLINARIDSATHCPHVSPDSDGKCPQAACSDDAHVFAAYRNATSGQLLEVETVKALYEQAALLPLIRQGQLLRLPASSYEGIDALNLTSDCQDDFAILQTNPTLTSLFDLAKNAGANIGACNEFVPMLTRLGSQGQCQSSTTLQQFGYDTEVAAIVQEACPASCGTC